MTRAQGRSGSHSSRRHATAGPTSSVLWVDEATAELRETVFAYVNAGAATPYEPRGFTRFRRMPSGAWLVDEWRLRLRRVYRAPDAFLNIVLQGFQENGGALEIVSEDRQRSDPRSR